MANEQIKASLAPCGLSCEKCFAHVDGDIRRYSLKLKEKLGNFHINAKRFETLLGDPIFKKCSASCLKTVGYAAVTRKNRLIFATSVTSFPVTEPILILVCIKVG
jgi:hypothetical protein